MIFSMLTPPYAVIDTHTDEFNELRNKVFYALRDAQNDEPVSDTYKLPVIGWLRSDYNSDDKRDPNAPLFMLGSNDPTETWGVKYIPLAGNSPVIPDGYCIMPVSLTVENGAKRALSGEFSTTREVTCPECDGDGCSDCDGRGDWNEDQIIDWPTIKLIYQKAVEVCAVPTWQKLIPTTSNDI